MMDTQDSLNANNPINCNEFVETCKHCQTDLENDKGEMVCPECDFCVICIEEIDECTCNE